MNNNTLECCLRSLLLILCVIPLYFLYSSCEEQGGCCTRFTLRLRTYIPTSTYSTSTVLVHTVLVHTVDYSETQSPHNFPISKCFSFLSFPSHHGIALIDYTIARKTGYEPASNPLMISTIPSSKLA